MCSRQYVAQAATGCPAKGKTIAKLNWRWSFYYFIRGECQAIGARSEGLIVGRCSF
jgi:hypothetical protein